MTEQTFRLVLRAGDVLEASARRESAEVPPSLALVKGFWATEIDAPPDFDPAYQRRTGPTWSIVEPVYDGEELISYGTATAAYVVENLALEDVQAARIAALEAFRYARETAGLTLGGMTIATDDRSKALIAGAYSAALAEVVTSFKWKTPAGFVALDAAQVIAAAEAVAVFVQACFSNEADHRAAILALESAEAVAAYDFSTGWPT